MYEAKDKEIDGHKVTVTQWPARKALTVKLRLVRAIGPGLGEIIGGMKGTEESVLDSDMDLSKVTTALEKLLSALDEATFMALIKTLISSVRVDEVDMSNEKEFDMMFTSKLELLYKVIWFVLEVNYGSFFGEGGIGEAVEKAKSLIPSQRKQTRDSQKT